MFRLGKRKVGNKWVDDTPAPAPVEKKVKKSSGSDGKKSESKTD